MQPSSDDKIKVSRVFSFSWLSADGSTGSETAGSLCCAAASLMVQFTLASTLGPLYLNKVTARPHLCAFQLACRAANAWIPRQSPALC